MTGSKYFWKRRTDNQTYTTCNKLFFFLFSSYIFSCFCKSTIWKEWITIICSYICI